MRQSIVRIATAIYIVGLVLAALILSIPPANLPIYLGLAVIALIPAIYGENRLRTFGGIAVLIFIILAGMEHFAGLKIQGQMRRFREQNTNIPTTNALPLNQP